MVRTRRCIVDNVGKSANENNVKLKVVTSLLKLADVVEPMEEGNDVEWRAVTSLLKPVDVV